MHDVLVATTIAAAIALLFVLERMMKTNPFERTLRKRYSIHLDPARYATVNIYLKEKHSSRDVKNAIFDAAYEFPELERIRIEGASFYISKAFIEPMRHFEYEIVGQENGWTGKELYYAEIDGE